MIYPTLPPPPHDPLLTVFIGVIKTALVLFLVAVVGLVAAVAISARNSPGTPTASSFANHHSGDR